MYAGLRKMPHTTLRSQYGLPDAVTVPDSVRRRTTSPMLKRSIPTHWKIARTVAAWGSSITYRAGVPRYGQDWCTGSLMAGDFRRRVSAEPVDRLAPVRRL